MEDKGESWGEWIKGLVIGIVVILVIAILVSLIPTEPSQPTLPPWEDPGRYRVAPFDIDE